MSECWALKRKGSKGNLVVQKTRVVQSGSTDGRLLKVLYKPFVSDEHIA